MRIIGIDPGTRHLGWGIVRAEGTRLICEGNGVVNPSISASLAERLVQIDEALGQVIDTYKPDEAAVETIFFAKDAQSASKLGHARGVVLLALARGGMPVHEYEPARVKRAVSGRGRADKMQVAMMVKAILGLTLLPATDASDALAVAITHAYFARLDSVIRSIGVGR